MNPCREVILLALLLTGSWVTFANADQRETLFGKVVSVEDGDSFTILDVRKRHHRIRLLGIDAPEKTQPYSRKSKQSLEDALSKKTISIEIQKRDRHQRIVGKVTVHSEDVALNQIKKGMAWHFKRYMKDQNPKDRAAYAKAEKKARFEMIGLWRADTPTPPWTFRRAKHFLPK